MRRLRVAFALACACAAAAACSDPLSHILQGSFYVEDRDCLGTPSSVDVIGGADPGSCAPLCLVQTTLDGGTAVYVTTTCGPYSPDYDQSGTNPECPRALAAFARNDLCNADGGSSNPLTPPPADAGDQ